MAMEVELLKSMTKKPITLRYPFEKAKPVEGLRGRPIWDMEKCIGCGLCQRDCPTKAIEMMGRGRQAEFRIYYDRCAFCAQCVESCPVGAITMTKEYELAAFEHEQMRQEYRRPRTSPSKRSESKPESQTSTFA
ncbi:NADH-quinone oxidoreductase subunit I [Candidatus Bathyarchaeota archaeon]|nr:NADH-quinone oxidoreductase subunit I [Candidatus Bathyarchaeota archaeon]